MTVEPDRRADRTGADVPFGKLILGGIGVGAIVFGLGSRVAMRVVGFIASPEHFGEPTAFGTIGRVTVAGVVGLVVFGSIAGLFTGLLYLAVRPWLPGRWGVRTLMFSLFLLVPIGVITIASSRADFVLASPTLILVIFGAMTLADGLATVWLIERLGRGSLPPPRPHASGYLALGAIALIGFVALSRSVNSIL